jgi:hypothetical protein
MEADGDMRTIWAWKVMHVLAADHLLLAELESELQEVWAGCLRYGLK